MIKCVVGLGNPGEQYKFTRHNVGFMLLDKLIEKRASLRPKKLKKSLLYEYSGKKLVYPMTFMNLSGKAVKEVMSNFGILPQEILVISDDFNLPLGKIRLRKKGSAGGHNGLQSVIDEIGTADFARLRMGIGPVERDVIDFVLSDFSNEQKELLQKMLDAGVKIVYNVFSRGIDFAISNVNSMLK